MTSIPKLLRSKVVEHGVTPLRKNIEDPWFKFTCTVSFEAAVRKEFSPDNFFRFLLYYANEDGMKAKKLMEKFAEGGKKIEPFIKYLNESRNKIDKGYGDIIFKTATYNKNSYLFEAFELFGKEEFIEDDIRSLQQFNNLLLKDDYHKFMTSFNKFMTNLSDNNFPGSDQKELKKMHELYWDSEMGMPRDPSEVDDKLKKAEQEENERKCADELHKMKVEDDELKLTKKKKKKKDNGEDDELKTAKQKDKENEEVELFIKSYKMTIKKNRSKAFCIPRTKEEVDDKKAKQEEKERKYADELQKMKVEDDEHKLTKKKKKKDNGGDDELKTAKQMGKEKEEDKQKMTKKKRSDAVCKPGSSTP